MSSPEYRRLRGLVDVDAQSECTAAEFIAMHGGTANDLLRGMDVEKPNKYRNIKTEVDGIVFDSGAEAKRYGELRLMERQGEIGELVLQPWFDLYVGGVKICRYVGDFEYFIGDKHVIEDVKGVRTAEYRIKKKLLKATHGIDIVEVE